VEILRNPGYTVLEGIPTPRNIFVITIVMHSIRVNRHQLCSSFQVECVFKVSFKSANTLHDCRIFIGIVDEVVSRLKSFSLSNKLETILCHGAWECPMAHPLTLYKYTSPEV